MPEPVAPDALIKRAQNGDREAFEALLRRHYDLIFRIAYKWCGNRADAEDITQNACIKLARSIGSFRFEASFPNWLYAIVINTAKDWQKSRARHRGDELSEHLAAETPSAESAVFASQAMAFIRELPEREKTAIYLVFGEGLSHSAAAAVMTCKESTVSWYIHEARKKLQTFGSTGGRHG